MSSVLEFAQRYLARSYSVVPIPYKSKGPVVKEWQKLRLTQEELPAHFKGQPQNIGILLGEPESSPK